MRSILTAEMLKHMKALTEGLQTKAEKIRQLGTAGYARQQIADFLGIRYQHVRNVLVDEERRIKAAMGPPPADWPVDLEYKSAIHPDVLAMQEDAAQAPHPPRNLPEAADKPSSRTAKVRIGPGGQLAIPPRMIEALGWQEGQTIWVHLEDDGEILLQDVHALTRRVQAYAREHLSNLGTVDDFLAWRREEAAREEREMQRWLGKPETGSRDG